MAIAPPRPRRSSIRLAPDRKTVDNNLGLIANLAGTWEGEGFNLIARPDRQGGSPLFLEINQTFEDLEIVPISSTIPNRGSAADDIDLFGLTYLQKVSDEVTKGALHIEPGMWVHVPSQNGGTIPLPGGKTADLESIFRLGTVPHGNSLLAAGTAFKFEPVNPFDPDLLSATTTAPFPVGTPLPIPGTLGGFPPYDLSNLTPAAVDFRTPAGDNPATPLPPTILGVKIQDVVNDPTKLLTAALRGQIISSMVVINIASVASQLQLQKAGQPVDILAPFKTGGGVENIQFLHKNADAATVFATFWIEWIKGATPDEDFVQLQYVQTVLLNFPIIANGAPVVPNLSWPHVSVATLRKTFGGQ